MVAAQLRHNVQKRDPADAALAAPALVEREDPGKFIFNQRLGDAPRRFGAVELGTEPARGGVEPLGRAVRAAPGVTVAGNVALLPGIRIERAVAQIIAARAARLPVFPEGRIRRRDMRSRFYRS